ncbi:MAG: hypothetical protein J0653_01920, partial [Deltaproteobacteria bacterium]|nr:hypothetical protein [Deltaproteobacteria bacterium]
ITGTQIADAAIGTAQIGTAQVDTLQIKGNAVTVPVNVYTAGTQTFPGTVTWQTIQTISIDSESQPISISASAFIKNAYNLNEGVRPSATLLRIIRAADSVVIYSVRLDPGVVDTATHYNCFSTTTLDSAPNAGTNTYRLEVQTEVGAGYIGITSNRGLFAIGVKR